MTDANPGSLLAVTTDIQSLLESEGSGVLRVVVDTRWSAPNSAGAKMLVYPDGAIHGTVGGGVVEARVIADALNALEDGQGPRTQAYNLAELGMRCGGEMSVYFEPLIPPRRVVLYGGGHVASAVAQALRPLGCRLTVVDEREEWANRERFPHANSILNQPFPEALRSLPPDPRDHILIATRGHEHDQIVLEGIVRHDVAYLGMLGSRNKIVTALSRLRTLGVPEDRIRWVRTPVGLPLGAVSPEEIAVSIVAELVCLWRRGPEALQRLRSVWEDMP